MELIKILKHKKRGTLHCPKCLDKLKDVGICFKCSQCMKYYAKGELTHKETKQNENM